MTKLGLTSLETLMWRLYGNTDSTSLASLVIQGANALTQDDAARDNG